jgi:hypothetical protein
MPQSPTKHKPPSEAPGHETAPADVAEARGTAVRVIVALGFLATAAWIAVLIALVIWLIGVF